MLSLAKFLTAKTFSKFDLLILLLAFFINHTHGQVYAWGFFLCGVVVSGIFEYKMLGVNDKTN